jgi:hypothetical protein
MSATCGRINGRHRKNQEALKPGGPYNGARHHAIVKVMSQAVSILPVIVLVLAGSGVLPPQARTEADGYALLFELRYHGSTSAGKVVKSQPCRCRR